jgi:uncharacterized membrane protein YfcA
MSVLVFTLIILIGSYFAGLLGSLTGLGGGFVIIPLLTLLLHVDIHYAIGASLVSVIATSSGSAAAYVREGITNIRLGMFLEIATTAGAMTGAILAVYIPTHYIAILLGVILIFSAVMSLRKKSEQIVKHKNQWAEKLKLNSSYPTAQGTVNYSVTKVGGGFFMMLFAGVLSGLLGVGSGALKVLAMDTIMRIPFKVSTTTSNFMIGARSYWCIIRGFKRIKNIGTYTIIGLAALGICHCSCFFSFADDLQRNNRKNIIWRRRSTLRIRICRRLSAGYCA